MDVTEFLMLWNADRAAAREQALALGPRIIGLAAMLSARFAAHDPRGSYTYWLRAVRCPELSDELRADELAEYVVAEGVSQPLLGLH